MPFTAGFIAKFSVITAAADAGEYLLAVVAMVSAVIAMFLYLRVIVSMYMSEPTAAEEATWIPVPVTAAIALVVAVGFTIVAGVPPASWSTSPTTRCPAWRSTDGSACLGAALWPSLACASSLALPSAPG